MDVLTAPPLSVLLCQMTTVRTRRLWSRWNDDLIHVAHALISAPASSPSQSSPSAGRTSRSSKYNPSPHCDDRTGRYALVPDVRKQDTSVTLSVLHPSSRWVYLRAAGRRWKIGLVSNRNTEAFFPPGPHPALESESEVVIDRQHIHATPALLAIGPYFKSVGI